MLLTAIAGSYLLVGVLLLLLPRFTRHNVFFSVALPEGFRESEEGRRRLRQYRLVVGAALAMGLALMTLAPAPMRNLAGALYPLVLIVVSAVAYFTHYRALLPQAVQALPPDEEQSPAGTIPAWSLLMVIPFLVLAGAALYLQTHWDQIPERFPVHWGADGEANRWAERTAKGVFGPLAFGGALCGWFAVMALSGWFGARRTRSRTVMLGLMVGVQHFLALLFGVVALMPLLHTPVWVMVVMPLMLLTVVLVVFAREWSAAGGPADTTPNECWRAGMFYYNPADSAVLVEKRLGLGFTLNFGNPWSWVLLAGLLLTMATAPLVLV